MPSEGTRSGFAVPDEENEHVLNHCPTKEDDVYTSLLDKLEAIRSHVKDTKLCLPQIVVIGDQSSGKSSLLSEITGIEFPNESGITTKKPIVVHTKRSSQHVQTTKEKGREDDDIHITIEDEVIPRDQLVSRILKIQKTTLGERKVDPEPIYVKAEGPDLKNLVLVDLPGIIHSGEGKEEVREMIRQYISPQQTLIIVVTEAKQDDEGAEANDFIKTFDPKEDRTLRVLTKFDNFDSQKSKDRAVGMVCNEGVLSPHAVVCRPNGEPYDETKETRVLGSYQLPSDRAGCATLRDRLPILLNERIKINLPGLKKDIDAGIENNRRELARIGVTPPNVTQLLLGIQAVLQRTANTKHLQVTITPLLQQFQESIHATQSKITEELVDQHYKHDVFEPPFYQGKQAFDDILQIITDDWWKPIQDTLIGALEGVLSRLFSLDDPDLMPQISSRTLARLREAWAEVQRTTNQNVREAMRKLREQECRYKTMNHYLTSKYTEEMMLPETLIDGLTDRMTQYVMRLEGAKPVRELQPVMGLGVAKPFREEQHVTNQHVMGVPGTKLVREQQAAWIREIIEDVVEEHKQDFDGLSLDEQHKQRVLAATRAYWAVSHKTVIDDTVAIVRDALISPVCEWVQTRLVHDKAMLDDACEDKRTAQRRVEYADRIERLEKCKALLQGYF